MSVCVCMCVWSHPCGSNRFVWLAGGSLTTHDLVWVGGYSGSKIGASEGRKEAHANVSENSETWFLPSSPTSVNGPAQSQPRLAVLALDQTT